MSKIIRLQSENVKRLRAVDITPKSNVVVIGGKNGNGKTSVLDSIAMALGGGDEIPERPVHKGTEKARIVLELDDLIIKRTFTAAGGTQLVVENKEGARYPKPQDMLDKLTGKLTFDPLEFIELGKTKDGKRRQLESLKKLLGLDFTDLDAKRKALYDERTLVNKQAEQAKAQAEFMPSHPDAPADEQSVTAIVEERDRAKEHNAKKAELEKDLRHETEVLEDAVAGRKSLIDEIAQLEERLTNLRKQVAEYDEAIPRINQRFTAAEKALSEFVPIDVIPINTKLANAELTNRNVRENQARAAALVEAEKIAAKANALTKQIEAIDELKVEQIAAAKFPVPGLSFDDTGVLFNDVPFDQASDAEKLRVSVAIAVAMNPKLRVMLVRNGSLLDDDSLALLTQLAIDANAQVWLEMVSTDAGKCSVIIEDGAVKQAAPVAEEQEEPAFPNA